MDMTFQWASLRGCGYPTLLYGMYIFTLFRWTILLRSTAPVMDWNQLAPRPGETFVSMPKREILGKCILRILIIAPMAGLAAVPFLTMDLALLKSPALWLFLTVIFPILVFSLYMTTLYDKIIYMI